MKENENIFKENSFKILLFVWKSVSYAHIILQFLMLFFKNILE